MRNADPIRITGIGMIRRLSIFASALSLLLFASAVLLWVRSYIISEEWVCVRVAAPPPRGLDTLDLTVSPSAGSLEIQFTRGRLVDVHTLYAEFGVSDDRIPEAGWFVGHVRPRTTTSRDRDTIWKRIGFGWYHGGFSFENGDQSWWITDIPFWLIALVTVTMPVRSGLVFLSRRRGTRRGLCPSCRYDLRASKGRCPECGTPIAQNREANA